MGKILPEGIGEVQVCYALLQLSLHWVVCIICYKVAILSNLLAVANSQAIYYLAELAHVFSSIFI